MSQAAHVPGLTRRRLIAVLWATALSLILVAPMFSGTGHFLARDLVFVPHQPLTWQTLGLGDASPRAVPLDGWVALLTAVVDGGVLARLVLPGLLVLAAAGAVRLLPDLSVVPLIVVAGLVVWNPYVVERLALGQWALLASYAALPWLLAAAEGYRQAPSRHSLAPVLGWVVLASITPSGGLIVTCLLAVHLLVSSGRTWLPVVGSAFVQTPWVLAGVMGAGGGVSDSSGVAAFAPDTEARWGTVVALLGLSGIWDSHSEPGSRLTILGPVTAVVFVLVLALGLRRVLGEVPAARTLAVTAGGGLAWALILTTEPGRALAESMVGGLPGAGLLRDGQKFLLPLVLVVALAAGVVVHLLVLWIERRGAGSPELLVAGVLPVVLTPVLLLPDAARVVWPTVRPVHFPDSFQRVDALTRGTDGYLATAPWRSYRDFAWGAGTTSSDPATRLLHAPVITSDDLVVGETTITGEGSLAARVGEELASRAPVSALGSLGVSWVLVYLDDPEAAEVNLRGAREVYHDEHLALYRVDGNAPVRTPSVMARVGVAAAHCVPLLVLALALSRRYPRFRRRAR